MQIDEKRACTACGAENPTSASFCWKCYASFGVQQPAPPPLPGAPGTPANPPGYVGGYGGRPGFSGRPDMAGSPVSAPVPAPAQRSGVSTFVKLAVGAVAAAAGYFGVQAFLSGGMELPDEIAGSPRMTGPIAEAVEEQVSSVGSAFGFTLDGAMYGGTVPEFALMVASDVSGADFDELITEMNADPARGATESGSRANERFQCQEQPDLGQGVTFCAWEGGDYIGIVMVLESDPVSAQATMWAADDALAESS